MVLSFKCLLGGVLAVVAASLAQHLQPSGLARMCVDHRAIPRRILNHEVLLRSKRRGYETCA